MNTIENIKTRRSIRKYQQKEIPREIMMDILDCGRLTPSAKNAQLWRFVVITDRAIKEKLTQICKHGKFINEAYAIIAIFYDKDVNYKVEDASAATQNMMLAAWEYGIGSCWIGSYQRDHSKQVEELLKCPDNYELITMFTLGYPAETRETRNKKQLDEIISFNYFI